MPRQIVPFVSTDMSALAKSLRAQLASRSTPPSHVEMLNMLARAVGHRNFQQLRARPASPVVAAPRVQPDDAAVSRARRYFDGQGRLQSWPARTSIQNLCLWVLWSQIPRGAVFDEPAINNRLRALHLFGDHAIIRRTMCALGLLARSADGREYRRVERPPTSEGAALIRALSVRPASVRPAPAAPAAASLSGDPPA